MSVQIGRVGIDIPLDDPEEWEADGDTVKFSGQMLATSVTDIEAQRQQLLGYAGPADEAAVYFSWTADPTWNGLWTIDSAKVDTYTMTLATFCCHYEVEMTRIRGFQTPLVETTNIGAVRSNAFAIASGQALHAFSGSADEQFIDTAGFTTFSRQAENVPASMACAYTAAGLSTATIFRARATAEFLYDGAATVENRLDGTNWRAVVGRQVAPRLSHWRINNSIVRCSVLAGAHGIALNFEWWVGSNWSAVKTFNLLPASGFLGLWSVKSVAIMRNSPECVVVRVAVGQSWSTTYIGRVYVDLSLTRGDRLVRGLLSADTASTWQIARSTAEACTAFTGGVRATANDADGNRFVMATSKAKTNDLVNGGFAMSSSVTQMDFGIGTAKGGGSAVAGDTATDIAAQYFWAGNVRQAIVSR